MESMKGTTGTNDDNQSAELVLSMEDKPKMNHQIDRVPTRLRVSKQYKNCCDPLVVSIGPYHFGEEQFKEFEELKIRIAEKLCRDYCKEKSLERLHTEVEKECGNALEYYEKDSIKCFGEYNMFLDACFVLYFIFFSEKYEGFLSREYDGVDARLNKNYHLVLRDLFLLENQIPLSVIKVLMEILKGEEKVIEILKSEEKVIEILKSEEKVISFDVTKKLIHNFIVDFSQLLMPCLAHFMGSSDQTEEVNLNLNLNESPHLLHLVREYLFPEESNKIPELMVPTRRINFRESYRSVTDLVSAGIYFKPSKTRNLTDVEFKSYLCFGILTLPSIKVDHLTKSLLLNLLAYEMCPQGPPHMRIASYICLMDALIDHADDVKELRKNRILVNKLGSDEHLAKLFNGIANDLVPVNVPLAYALAKMMIGDHCKSKRHIWMAEWVHKYFSSPWTLMAFLGALLVLALTMTQTIFAAYPRSPSN